MGKVKLKNIIEPPITGEWGVEDTTGDGVNIIRTTNFGKAGRINYSNLTKRLILKKNKEGDYLIDKDRIEAKELIDEDIIIEKSGGGPDTPVGRVVYFEKKDNQIYLCNNFTTLLRPKVERVNSKYLFYQFSYLYLIGKVKKYQNKTVGIYNLKLKKYLEEDITLPSITEQSKVVVQLNKIQELIDKRQETIKLLNDYLRSFYYENLGDPVLNSKKFKELSLSNEKFKLTSGITPSRKESLFFGGNILWVKSTDIKQNLIYNTEEKITELALDKTTAKIFPINSVLIAMYGQGKTRGNVALLKAEASSNQACAVIYPNEVISPICLYSQLNYSYKYLRSIGKGGNQNNLSLTALKKIKIRIPPKNIQNEFELMFLKIEKQITKYERSLEILELLFQASLHKAFSEEEVIDEDKIFEELIKDFTISDLKKGKRLDYLINWLNKNRFSNIENYAAAIEKLLKLLEDGTIKQYISKNNIKIKKS